MRGGGSDLGKLQGKAKNNTQVECSHFFNNHRAEIAYSHSFLLPLAKQLALISQELDPHRPVSAVKIGVDSITHLLQKVRYNRSLALGGIVLASRVMVGEPIAGYYYELETIAAVVICGAYMGGGEASIVGTLLGALIMGILKNGLNLLNIST